MVKVSTETFIYVLITEKFKYSGNKVYYCGGYYINSIQMLPTCYILGKSHEHGNTEQRKNGTFII
jgi:hypothetical protein